MQSLNKKSVAVFMRLTELLNADGRLRIAVPHLNDLVMEIREKRSDSAYESMTLYQMAHYSEQLGKLVPDPEVVFVCVDRRTATKKDIRLVSVYPESFRNSSFSLFSGVAGAGYVASDYEKLCSLSNHWFADIARQGFLSDGVVVVDKNYPF